jgi:ribosomal protein S12 methylthiotransferase accessory factor
LDPFETRLRLAPQLVLTTTPDGSTFLTESGRFFRIKEPLQRALLAAADGARTGQELLLDLDGRFGGAEVLHALHRLHARGILVEAELSITGPEAAFWTPEGLEKAGWARLGETLVQLDVLESAEAAALERALAGAGVQLASASGPAALALVVGDDYLDARLLERTAAHLARGVPCLPARIVGRSAWLGPLLRPDGGPCPRCLAEHIGRNRPIERHLARTALAGYTPAPLGKLPASVEAGASFVALRLADAIVQDELPRLAESLLELDLRSFRLSEHAVTRRPQCPACGKPAWMQEQMARPVLLQPREHAHDDDGGLRTVSPERTHEQYRSLVSPVSGVLTRLGELRERSLPITPVYAAGYFIAPLDAGSNPTETFDRMSLGKGRSHAQSRASALCEGLERYAAVWQGDEARVRNSYAELAPAAIDPRALQNFSDRQYAEQAPTSDRRRMIPLRFDPEQVLDWSPAWSLTREERRWLPTAYCFTHTPTASREQVALYNPNGHAAGNCLEEAILQGFLELVERDASAIWWYNRLARPQVDLASFGSEFFEQTLELGRSRGLSLHVLDLTHDLAIPVMVALGLEETTGRYFMGFGCHLDAELAVQRSLTELFQVYDPTGKGEAPFKRSDFEDERFLRPAAVAATTASAFASQAPRSLQQAVETCVERVARVGMETIVIDYTRPDIGLSTAKVVVPGLRHFWPRLGPGRLYDVPHALGWLPRPLAEDELNPVPLLM